jgi:hypothetical protein
MAHTTEMVREYASHDEYVTDERKLSQQGWTAQASTNPYLKQGLITRILGRFRQKPGPIVITYNRQRPS